LTILLDLSDNGGCILSFLYRGYQRVTFWKNTNKIFWIDNISAFFLQFTDADMKDIQLTTAHTINPRRFFFGKRSGLTWVKLWENKPLKQRTESTSSGNGSSGGANWLSFEHNLFQRSWFWTVEYIIQFVDSTHRSPTISRQQFQSGLKTHLFKRAYIWLLPLTTNWGVKLLTYLLTYLLSYFDILHWRFFWVNHSPAHEAEPLSSNVLTTAYADIVCFKAANFCMNKTLCLPSPTSDHAHHGRVSLLLPGLCIVSLPVPDVRCASFWRLVSAESML